MKHTFDENVILRVASNVSWARFKSLTLQTVLMKHVGSFKQYELGFQLNLAQVQLPLIQFFMHIIWELLLSEINHIQSQIRKSSEVSSQFQNGLSFLDMSLIYDILFENCYYVHQFIRTTNSNTNLSVCLQITSTSIRHKSLPIICKVFFVKMFDKIAAQFRINLKKK